MTRRLKAPMRRARRVARLKQEVAERDFNLSAVAARSLGDDRIAAPPWPRSDVGFLTAILHGHHVPAPLVRRLARAASAMPLNALLLERLSAALADQIHFAPLSEIMRHRVLLLAGPPGAGKTTLAAKLAARRGDKQVLLVGTDTARPGAMAQLQEYAGALGLPVAEAGDAAALKRIVADTAGASVLIDSAGVMPNAENALSDLAALVEASGAATVLVLPADSAAEDAIALVRFLNPLAPSALMPTRLDLVHRLGAVLAAADTGRLPLPCAGFTPHFAYGLRALTPPMVARRLLAAALHDGRSQLPPA